MIFSASRMVETISRTGVVRWFPTWRRVSSVVYMLFTVVSDSFVLSFYWVMIHCSTL